MQSGSSHTRFIPETRSHLLLQWNLTSKMPLSKVVVRNPAKKRVYFKKLLPIILKVGEVRRNSKSMNTAIFLSLRLLIAPVWPRCMQSNPRTKTRQELMSLIDAGPWLQHYSRDKFVKTDANEMVSRHKWDLLHSQDFVIYIMTSSVRRRS